MANHNALGESITMTMILSADDLDYKEIAFMAVVVKNTVAFRSKSSYIPENAFRMSHTMKWRVMKSLEDKGYISYKRTKQMTLYEILKVPDEVRPYLVNRTAVSGSNIITKSSLTANKVLAPSAVELAMNAFMEEQDEHRSK